MNESSQSQHATCATDDGRCFQYCMLTVALLLVTGCTLHEVDDQPVPTVAGSTEYSVSAEIAEARSVWWASLDDPILDKLIHRALADNLTLRQAAARLRQTRALYQQAAVAGLPMVDGTADASHSANNRGGTDTLSAAIALSWEIDLWNRLGSATDAARFSVQARREDYHALRLLISSEVAAAYYDSLEQRMQLALLSGQIKTGQTLLELTELRFTQGDASAVDVFQQRQQLESTREQVPVVQTLLRLAENRLDVLVAHSPDGINRVTRNELPKVGPLPSVGVPANLLVWRPDLRARQNELIAFDYRIAEALAEKLPRVGIGAAIGHTDTPTMSGMFRSVFASAVMPLIDWGSREAEVQRRRAVFDEQMAVFTRSYLLAIEEVENIMYRERRQREVIASLSKQRDLLQSTLIESRNRYSNGLTDYLPVLATVQALQRVERDLLQRQRELVTLRVLLYRAIGGALPVVDPDVVADEAAVSGKAQVKP